MFNLDVAIIVPYRDRTIHLKIFINYMNTFLLFQNSSARIYIVEQVSTWFIAFFGFLILVGEGRFFYNMVKYDQNKVRIKNSISRNPRFAKIHFPWPDY